jgi:hypothetical protein
MPGPAPTPDGRPTQLELDHHLRVPIGLTHRDGCTLDELQRALWSAYDVGVPGTARIGHDRGPFTQLTAWWTVTPEPDPARRRPLLERLLRR